MCTGVCAEVLHKSKKQAVNTSLAASPRKIGIIIPVEMHGQGEREDEVGPVDRP
jgi:hypothetical protein